MAAALPDDILRLIYKKLTFEPDYIRFRSVCKSWRSAAPKRPQLPWLISRLKDDNNNTGLSLFKLCPKSGKISPVLDLSESNRIRFCIGLSHGWVALDSSVRLLNPITGSTLNLPCLPEVIRFDTDFALTADPCDLSSDPVALVVHYDRVMVCRIGDDSWTSIECPLRGYNTRSCSHKGTFYIISYGDVYVYEFEKREVRMIASVSPEESKLCEIDESHLVESDGDLLAVLVFWSPWNKDCFEFKVFRVEFREQPKLVKLESLGDRALFLDRKSYFSVSASQIPDCKGNSIYYAWKDHNSTHAPVKIRVYSLQDGSNVFINNDVMDGKLCAWFTPSLLCDKLDSSIDGGSCST